MPMLSMQTLMIASAIPLAQAAACRFRATLVWNVASQLWQGKGCGAATCLARLLLRAKLSPHKPHCVTSINPTRLWVLFVWSSSFVFRLKAKSQYSHLKRWGCQRCLVRAIQVLMVSLQVLQLKGPEGVSPGVTNFSLLLVKVQPS